MRMRFWRIKKISIYFNVKISQNLFGPHLSWKHSIIQKFSCQRCGFCLAFCLTSETAQDMNFRHILKNYLTHINKKVYSADLGHQKRKGIKCGCDKEVIL